MTARHAWADPVRPDQCTTFRGCTRCGMCMVSRHEGREHWCEFVRMPDGARVIYDGRPPCAPALGVSA